MHKLIIDTDPGIDDAQAIAYAIAHPSIELIGLTTVFGNASVERTTANALNILEVFEQPHVPVAQGADVPLKIPPFPAPDFVHGHDGIGNLDLAPAVAHVVQTTAAEFIVEQACRYPGEVTVVAIGPMTNLALALQLDPQLTDKLKQVIVMGGAVNVSGNVSPVAEANFINDPDAADQVCGAAWPLTLIGLDVTMQIALTDSHFHQLRQQAGGIGEFLWQSSRFYVDFYTRVSPVVEDQPACAMHDASTLVYLTNPELFGFVSGPAVVVNQGPALGQLIVGQRQQPYLLNHWNERPVLQAALRVDAESVIQTFISALIGYHARPKNQ